MRHVKCLSLLIAVLLSIYVLAGCGGGWGESLRGVRGDHESIKSIQPL
jgi:hypothetical protein